MNVIKKYFLFFAPHPILYNFIAWIGAMATLIFLNWINGHFDNQPDFMSSTPSEVSLMSDAQFWVTSLSFVANIFLCYLILARNIIRPEYAWDDNDYFCRVALFPDGHFVIVEKAIWAQAEEINIRKIRDHSSYHETFECKTGCGGNYKNARVSIPVTLTFKLSGPFNKEELFTSLQKESLERYQKQLDVLDLDDYIKSVFKKMNLSNQPSIDRTIQAYAEQQISEPVLLDHVIEELIFPERLFSNIADVKICLGNPTHSSCKGMSCPSGEE